MKRFFVIIILIIIAAFSATMTFAQTNQTNTASRDHFLPYASPPPRTGPTYVYGEQKTWPVTLPPPAPGPTPRLTDQSPDWYHAPAQDPIMVSGIAVVCVPPVARCWPVVNTYCPYGYYPYGYGYWNPGIVIWQPGFGPRHGIFGGGRHH